MSVGELVAAALILGVFGGLFCVAVVAVVAGRVERRAARWWRRSSTRS